VGYRATNPSLSGQSVNSGATRRLVDFFVHRPLCAGTGASAKQKNLSPAKEKRLLWIFAKSHATSRATYTRQKIHVKKKEAIRASALHPSQGAGNWARSWKGKWS
jgi:hypothetical protein